MTNTNTEHSAFDNILGIGDSEEQDPLATGDEGIEGTQGNDQGEGVDQNSEALKKKLSNQDEVIRQQAEEIKKLNENAQKNQTVIDGLGEVFTGKSKPSKQEEEDAYRRAVEANPKKVLDEIENTVVNKVTDIVGNLDRKLTYKDAVKAIQREYDVDLKKNESVISKALGKISPESRASDPKGAIEMAMRIAGIGKKRKMPFIEGQGFNSPEAVKRSNDKKLLDKYIGPLKRSKEEVGSLDSFFNAIK